MIEVVRLEDLVRLRAIRDDTPRPKQRAAGILLEIIERLPRPRALILEPPPTPDKQKSFVWTMAFDVLTSMLSDERVAVVEPETIRDIALFSCFLDDISDAPDPLWQTILSFVLVDRVYIPDDGSDCRRHVVIKRYAGRFGIEVVAYRPAFVDKKGRLVPPHA